MKFIDGNDDNREWGLVYRSDSVEQSPGCICVIFFGARIRFGNILGRFSINYFSGLGLRIMVRVWVRVPG